MNKEDLPLYFAKLKYVKKRKHRVWRDINMVVRVVYDDLDNIEKEIAELLEKCR